MVHHNNCPLCKSIETDPFLTCTDHLVSREKFQIFRCRRCNFTFTNGYPGENESGSYYESDEYISHSGSGKTIFEKVYMVARRIMLRRKRHIVGKATGLPAGSILDIGCGTGHFLNAMKLAGWKTTGIEINQKAREYAIENFNLEVITPSEISSLNETRFDCISMWHVLEHLHNSFEWLSTVNRLLKPGGKLIIALPNSFSYDASHYSEHWAAYDVPRHLWHFSPDTLELFARKSGFRVIYTKVLPFDVFYISILSEKQGGSSLPVLKGIVKGCFFSVLSFFRPARSSSLVYALEAAEG